MTEISGNVEKGKQVEKCWKTLRISKSLKMQKKDRKIWKNKFRELWKKKDREKIL